MNSREICIDVARLGSKWSREEIIVVSHTSGSMRLKVREGSSGDTCAKRRRLGARRGSRPDCDARDTRRPAAPVDTLFAPKSLSCMRKLGHDIWKVCLTYLLNLFVRTRLTSRMWLWGVSGERRQ